MTLSKRNKAKVVSLLTCLILFFTACSSPNDENVKEETTESYKYYKINGHSEATPIYNIIDRAELMLFEQAGITDLALIRFFNFWEDQVAVSTFGNGNIHLFDQKGNYIKNINRLGNAPEDYKALWYTWIDNNEIVVYDATSRKVNYYNAQGKFHKTLPINYPTTGMYSFNNQFFYDTSDRLYNGKEAVNVVVLDMELNYQSSHLPYTLPEPIRTNWGPNTFEPYKGSIVYQDEMSNTMYQWNAASQAFDSLLTIDLGEDWVWDKPEYYGNKTKAKQVQETGEKVIRTKNVLGENYILHRFEQYGSFHTILIERETGKYKKLSSNQGILEDRTFVPIKWVGDTLVFSIQAVDLPDFVNALPAEKLSYKSETKNLAANKTDALFWITFKPSSEWNDL